MDTLLLSRIQFGANISFHILFPTITIALGWVLLYFKLRFVRSGDDKWIDAYRFWIKVFALSFALGVVSGITMSFQFGTNWPGFMEAVGNIAGPLLAYEVTDGVLPGSGLPWHHAIRVQRKVPNWLHTLGDLPCGLRHDDVGLLDPCPELELDAHAGRAIETARWHRLCDRLVGDHLQPVDALSPDRICCWPAGLTVAFLIWPVSAALRLLWGDRTESVKCDDASGHRCSVLGAVPDPHPDLRAGDMHGLNTLEHQPARRSPPWKATGRQQGNVPLLLFAIPDEEAARTNRTSRSVCQTVRR